MTRLALTDPGTSWAFDGEYGNLAQVEQFLPDFLAVLAELEAAGQYRYNDSFKGRIPGLDGPHEDAAIYLLQGLERQNKQDAKVAALLADGYEWIDTIDKTTRFAHIVFVPQGRMGGEWREYTDARLGIFPGSHNSLFVIPKGRRTNGYLASGRRVLAKVAA
jgi:hypothetical protein